MSKLSLRELSKEFAPRHPEHPKLRYTLLVSKIASREPFELLNGTSKVLDYATDDIGKKFEDGNLEALKGNQNLFKDATTGTLIRMDSLKKTDEFGGGSGGSGAGSDVTALVESAQCLYCALVWYVFRRKLALDEIISPAQFETASNYIDVTEPLENMKQLPDDWIKSSILGANKLYDKFRSVTDYRFHRGSGKVDEIENTFKLVNRQERAFGNLNKWSPADMYMIKSGHDMSSITGSKSLKGLNGEMKKLYKEKKVVGVSLKKIESSTVLFSELNLEETTSSTVGFKGFTLKANDRATIYDSMDIYLKFGVNAYDRIQFRSFGDGDGLTGFQGEIKGQSANQGKVSLGPATFIFKQHARVTLPTSESIATRVRTKDDRLVEEIYDMANSLGINNLPDRGQHKILSMQQSPKWRYSKYLGFKIASILNNQSSTVQDKIVKDLYFYAGSKNSFSGPYAKIEG